MTSRIALKSLIAVVSRKSLDTSRIALQSLGRDQQDVCGVSRTSLGTSRIAVKSLRGVLGAAG